MALWRGKNKNPVATENSLIRGLVLDSRDLFSRERYEDRIELELATYIYEYKKNETIDVDKLKTHIEEFIKVVEIILEELEKQKRLATQEEVRKMDSIRSILVKGARYKVKEVRQELEKFGQTLRSDTLSALRRTRRREMRLRRGGTPFGFVLKKMRTSEYLDKEVEAKAFKIGEHTNEENKIIKEIEENPYLNN